MIYRPDEVMSFGMNKGYTLKEIFYYSPSYIEWLIKFRNDFEINVNDFEFLPTVKTDLEIPDDASIKDKVLAELKKDFSIGTPVEKIKTGNRKFHPNDYKFPEETLIILKKKKENNYTAPDWNKAIPKKLRSFEEFRKENKDMEK